MVIFVLLCAVQICVPHIFTAQICVTIIVSNSVIKQEGNDKYEGMHNRLSCNYYFTLRSTFPSDLIQLNCHQKRKFMVYVFIDCFPRICFSIYVAVVKKMAFLTLPELGVLPYEFCLQKKFPSYAFPKWHRWPQVLAKSYT